MRIFPPALMGTITLGFVLAGWAAAGAQLPNSQHKKVLGYQDENGAFHPLNRAVPDAATSVTVTGTINITFHITVKSSFPSGTKIYCGAVVTAESETASDPLKTIVYEEEAAAEASGTTCTATIPYSWTINPSGTGVVDVFTGSYTVLAVNSSVPTVLDAVGVRLTTGNFADLVKIPATGTTTPFTVDVTI